MNASQYFSFMAMLRTQQIYSPRFTGRVFLVPNTSVHSDLFTGFNQWQNIVSGQTSLSERTNFRTNSYFSLWNRWYHRTQPYTLTTRCSSYFSPHKLPFSIKDVVACRDSSVSQFVSFAYHNKNSIQARKYTVPTCIGVRHIGTTPNIMEDSKQRYPKRQRTPSGSETCDYKRNPKKSYNAQSKSNHQAESAGYSSGKSSHRGFTQLDWPKSAQDCEWRKHAQAAQAAAASRNIKYIHGVKHSQETLQWTESQHYPSPRQILTHNSAKCFEDTRLEPAWSVQSNHGSSDRGQYKRLWWDCQHEQVHRRSSHPSKSHRQKFEFSVMSYNILAQCLLEDNRHLYHHCQEHVLYWKYRRQNLLREILASNADIVCLQEAQSKHLREFFQPEMKKMGYAVLYKKRTGDKMDGCATFYKQSRFEEVQHTMVEFQRRTHCLDRDNVAVIVILQPRGLPSSYQLCVANTHLLWNPRRGDVKLAQLGVLFAEIDKIAHVSSSQHPNTYHPVIICGDFNSVPHCPLFNFVSQGNLRYEGIPAIDISGQEQRPNPRKFLTSPLWPDYIGITDRCQYRDSSEENAMDVKAETFSETLTHPFMLSSTHTHHPDGNEITTNHSRTNSTVDYIFYTKGKSDHKNPGKKGECGEESSSASSQYSSTLSLLERLSLFTDAQVQAMGGLPNSVWSSDHFSLQARFLLSPCNLSRKK